MVLHSFLRHCKTTATLGRYTPPVLAAAEAYTTELVAACAATACGLTVSRAVPQVLAAAEAREKKLVEAEEAAAVRRREMEREHATRMGEAEAAVRRLQVRGSRALPATRTPETLNIFFSMHVALRAGCAVRVGRVQRGTWALPPPPFAPAASRLTRPASLLRCKPQVITPTN